MKALIAFLIILGFLVFNVLANLLPKQAESRKPWAWLIRSTLSLLLGSIMLLLSISQPVFAQEIIVHSGPFVEDGDSRFDADGSKNGVVVWKGVGVHVVTSYHVSANQTLIINPGAVVKVAGKFGFVNGRVTEWEPPSGGGGITSDDRGTIQIEGATITDIRDDSVGGDTNQDGAITSPSASTYVLRFSGTDQDHLKNSTIKYCQKMGHIGSMQITANKFIGFGGLSSLSGFPLSMEPVVVSAVPVISGNTFEFIPPSLGGGGLDLRGMSAVVDNNTLRGGQGIWIGPLKEYPSGADPQRIGPITGTTIISNNRIEGATDGVRIYTVPSDTLYTKARFRAEVSGNTLRGAGSTGTALELALDAEAVVSSNDVSGYLCPLRLTYNQKTETSRLDIKSNHFSLEGADTRFGCTGGLNEQLWKNGHFVKAEGNFWGDPTGPFDNSNADGLTNPRGRGLKIGDGIDYVPFIGGSAPPPKDRIHITTSSTPTQPLNPNATVTFNVTADAYDLLSAPTGQIVVLVRDVDGTILNQPGTSVNVTSENHTAAIPPVSIRVPDLTNLITVEAAIVPDGGGESVRSNVERFVVAKPASNFTIASITEVPSGNTPDLVRGNRVRIKLALSYTLAGTGNGQFEIDIKEQVKGTATVVRDISQVTLDVPPGPNQTAEREFEMEVPLRDVLKEPPGELYVEVTMKDGTGTAVGKLGRILPINETANQVRFSRLERVKVVNFQPVPGEARYYLLVGDVPGYAFSAFYRIGTQNVTNWQVRVGDDEALDSKGAVLHRYTARENAVDNASTGPEREVRGSVVGETTLPPGTRRYRVYVKLVAPGNITVAAATFDVEVREAVQSLSMVVPEGASQVAFRPLPITLNLASNQKVGTATAEEFAGQFGAPSAAASLAKPDVSHLLPAQAAVSYERLIPLKKYWSVYSDLQEGTFSATVSFTYNPDTDFPDVPEFSEDSLVVAGLNPLSGELEGLPSTLDKAARTVTTAYTTFFDTYVVASRSVVSADVPNIEVTPASLDFGSVAVGQSRDLTLTVSNTGNALLTVSSITSDNPRFSVTSPATPFTVEAGSEQPVTVRFAPSSADPQTGTLTIGSNDPSRPSVNVSLTGTGTAVVTPPTRPPLPPPGQEPPPRPARPPVFGPVDGELLHDADEFIEEYEAAVDVRDFDVEARFFNPYPAEEETWDYGFLLRVPRQNTFHGVIIDSDGFWQHWLRLGGEGVDESLAEGFSEAIDTSPNGGNLVRVIASADTGWLYINDQLVTTLDLSGLSDSGDISAMTGFYGVEVPGEVSRFEGFSVWDLRADVAPPAQEPPPRPNRPRFGPVDRAIRHTDDGVIDGFFTRVNTAHFDVEARFYNPYPLEEGSWDYGFQFRFRSGSDFQIVIIDSEGFWTHRLRMNNEDKDLDFNFSDVIDTSADGSNLVRLVGWGDTGWLYINGELMSTLNLSGLTGPGNISAFTGFFEDNLIDGQITRFEELTVWELAPPSEQPTLTPSPVLSPTPTPMPPGATCVTTQPAPPLPQILIPEGQQNLSLLAGVRADSSTDFNASYDAPKAIDGDLATAWYTANNDEAPSYTISFPQDVTIHSLQILPSSTFPTGYSFCFGSFQVFDGSGNVLFDSRVVTTTTGYIDVAVSPPVSGARSVKFTAIKPWESIEPGFGEFAVVGTVRSAPRTVFTGITRILNGDGMPIRKSSLGLESR